MEQATLYKVWRDRAHEIMKIYLKTRATQGNHAAKLRKFNANKIVGIGNMTQPNYHTITVSSTKSHTKKHSAFRVST